MHAVRLNKVWENFVDDWCIRTGRFSDGEPVTEAEYLRKRANVPTTARVGENDRTLEDALDAAGYVTGGPAVTARSPEAKDEEAEAIEEQESDDPTKEIPQPPSCSSKSPDVFSIGAPPTCCAIQFVAAAMDNSQQNFDASRESAGELGTAAAAAAGQRQSGEREGRWLAAAS